MFRLAANDRMFANEGDGDRMGDVGDDDIFSADGTDCMDGIAGDGEMSGEAGNDVTYED